MTLLLVTSHHIFYLEVSYDPIFPAKDRYPFGELQKDYSYNNDSRARPMACVETSEVCSANGQQCWSMRVSVPCEITAHPSFYLRNLSLENSNIKTSMEWCFGAAFEAEEKIGQLLSTPVEPNQWEVEARQLFMTLLARIQYDA